MTQQDKRTALIKILARNADEPQNTVDAIMNLFREPSSESRAYSLYCAGKYGTEIAEILSEEYTELDADQIDKIVNDAKERYMERSIPLENNNE